MEDDRRQVEEMGNEDIENGSWAVSGVGDGQGWPGTTGANDRLTRGREKKRPTADNDAVNAARQKVSATAMGSSKRARRPQRRGGATEGSD